MRCEQLTLVLDRAAGAPTSDEVAAHSASCAACRERLAEWDSIRAALATAEEGWEPNELDVVRLMARARHARPVRRSFVPLLAGAAALAGLAAVALLALPERRQEAPAAPGLAIAPEAARPLEPPSPVSEPTPRRVARREPAPLPVPPGSAARQGSILRTAEARARFSLGSDRVGATPHSEGRVIALGPERTRFRVSRGTFVFEVAKRPAGSTFEVEAADYLVVVIGTRFAVSLGAHDDVAVAVDEGTVQVLPPAAPPITLRAGQRIAFGSAASAAPSPVPAAERDAIREALELANERLGEAADKQRKPKAVDPRSTWRTWIGSGNFEAVEVALEDHLRANPGDVEAWMLLGEARAGSQHWDLAVEAYENAVRRARAAQANEARLAAAVILQEKLERHDEAVQVLRAYLEQKQSARPREAAAMIRVAKSMRALGHVAEATEILRAVMVKYKSTPEGTEARYLITQWSRAE